MPVGGVSLAGSFFGRGASCKLPQNPFVNANPKNPMSMYGAASNYISSLLGTQACLESDTTAGVLGAQGYNPQENIHKRFQVAALLRRMYDFMEYMIEQTKEMLKALKDTHQLAFPAK